MEGFYQKRIALLILAAPYHHHLGTGLQQCLWSPLKHLLVPEAAPVVYVGREAGVAWALPAWPLGSGHGKALSSIFILCSALVHSWRLADWVFVMALSYCWNALLLSDKIVSQAAWVIIKNNCLFIWIWQWNRLRTQAKWPNYSDLERVETCYLAAPNREKTKNTFNLKCRVGFQSFLLLFLLVVLVPCWWEAAGGFPDAVVHIFLSREESCCNTLNKWPFPVASAGPSRSSCQKV